MNWKLAGMAGTAVAVIALSGASAVAGANKFTGNISLAVGQTFQDDLGGAFDDSYTSISGGAKLNIAFTNNLNLQLDFAGTAGFVDQSNPGFSLDRDAGFQAAAHGYYRTDRYAVGLFAGAGVASGPTFGVGADAEYYFAGAQGQYYWNNFTFGLEGGFLDSNSDLPGVGGDEVFLSDAWFGGAEVRWYATPKVALTANVGYIDGEAFAGALDVNTWHWGAKVEYKPEEKEPLTLWVAYEGRTTEAEFGVNSVDKDTHVVKIGLTFQFGVDGSQVEQDRSGPSFNTMDYGAIVVGG
ncbi:MAG: hypothetical protein KBA31_21280 [Alphaproteobacteria bacterium]|nr:hypothetical protein [Alphaproteobacteria bacterium]